MPSGMPHSAGALPAPSRASAARACARASCSHTVMNAWSVGSAAAMRSRQARVSCVAVISRARSLDDASAIVSLFSSDAMRGVFSTKLLLDYFRHFEVTALARRRVGEHRIGVGPVGHFVVAHRHASLADLRRRRDLFGVEFVQFINVGKHFVHVGAQALFLFRRPFQARQPRDVAHLLEGYLGSGHGDSTQIVTFRAIHVRAAGVTPAPTVNRQVARPRLNSQVHGARARDAPRVSRAYPALSLPRPVKYPARSGPPPPSSPSRQTAIKCYPCLRSVRS